jgi:hypothetical protein
MATFAEKNAGYTNIPTVKAIGCGVLGIKGEST